MNVKDCLDKGYFKLVEQDKELSLKELSEARYDFEKAEEAFHSEDYKWCIVKSYYSMCSKIEDFWHAKNCKSNFLAFHAAKSLLFNIGYIEKRHIAVLIVLEDLAKEGNLDSKFVTYFKASMTARQDADYHYSHSQGVAEHELDIAKEFLKEVETQLK